MHRKVITVIFADRSNVERLHCMHLHASHTEASIEVQILLGIS